MKNRIIMLYLLAIGMNLFAVESVENTKQFNALLATGAPAVVLFYEDKSPQVQQLIDTFDSVSQAKEGLNFIRVNVMLNGLRNIAGSYNLQTFPVILLFDGRNPIKDNGQTVMLTGYVSSQAIHNFIDQYFARADDSNRAYDEAVYDDRPVVIYRDRPYPWIDQYYYPWPYYYRYGNYWGRRRYYGNRGHRYRGKYYGGRGRYYRGGRTASTVRTGRVSRPVIQTTTSRPASVRTGRVSRPTGSAGVRPVGASRQAGAMRTRGMRSGGMRSGGRVGGGGRGGRR